MGVLSEGGASSQPTPLNCGGSLSPPELLGPYTSDTSIPHDSDYLVFSGGGDQCPSAQPVAPASTTLPKSMPGVEGGCSAQSLGGPTQPSTAGLRTASSGRGLWLTSPAVLDGKFVGLFFGADWCPYCKTFLSPLIKFYNFLRPTGMFEVVYVPCDRNMREYQSFVKTMPWYALPLRNYGDLVRKYNVKSLPSLVLVTPDDAVLSSNATDLVKEKNAGEKFRQIFQRLVGKLPMFKIHSTGKVLLVECVQMRIFTKGTQILLRIQPPPPTSEKSGQLSGRSAVRELKTDTTATVARGKSPSPNQETGDDYEKV